MSTRTLSLLKPTGHLTLGNYLGALRPLAAAQDLSDCFVGVADLHALTVAHDPAVLRRLGAECATLLVACGLDRATLFVQSRVPAHRSLGYLLECVATTGELNRMIQFKEKGRGRSGSRVSLYTYPTLMAADILLYAPQVVPVGDDQRQHLELTRDLATRFNNTYGAVFTVPQIATPAAGARVMDLQHPTDKMGKSQTDGAGIIYLLDPPDVVRRKIARAVTDSDTGPDACRRDPTKPGVSNLLDILAACAGPDAAAGLTTYGALKAAVTEAVVGVLAPIQERYRALSDRPAELAERYRRGEERCREVTRPVLAAAEAAVGLDLLS